MGIDFYDRMWEEEQKEKERFGQRRNEIENELLTQRRKIEELEKENEQLKEDNKVERENAVTRLFQNQRLEKDNAELKAQLTILEKRINTLKIKNASLENKVKKMEQDQKTAYTKGMRHFAKAIKEYDRTKGAWTDYFEHTADNVLKQELEK